MKKRVKFCLQPTRSFPDGAPDRCEYSSDARHDAACERYCAEWLEQYECTGCKASDCPANLRADRRAPRLPREPESPMKPASPETIAAVQALTSKWPPAEAPRAQGARMTAVPALLAQLDATARDLEHELRVLHPSMKRPEVAVILSSVAQVRARLTREGRDVPQTTIAPSGINHDREACARRRRYRTMEDAARAARERGARDTRIVACAVCERLHLELPSPAAATGATPAAAGGAAG